MAVYKIFPSQDTTLYSSKPELNSGLDEIIETSLLVGALITPSPQASRFLIQFTSGEISDVITNKIAGLQWQANLRCFVAEASGLTSDTNIDVYPVSQSWNMGTGKYLNDPETQNGASWLWKDTQGSVRWISGSLNAGTTSSYSGSSTNAGGGTWFVTQSMSGSTTFGYYDDKDININVTTIINAWNSSSIPNNGFIVKQRTEFTDDVNIQPQLKYFSIDTHTIYPPCLEFKWRDYIFNTGSVTQPILNTSPFIAKILNNPGIFYSGSINKFRVNARPEYPTRIFQTSSIYSQNYYLPTSSYYAIKDLDTNEFVVDFDTQYTQISLDTTSSYFNVYMNGLQPERNYQILIKTTIDGSTVILDNDYYFKIKL